jgi:hypothetical protein
VVLCCGVRLGDVLLCFALLAGGRDKPMSERCNYFHDLNGGQKMQCPLELGHTGPHPAGWPGPIPQEMVSLREIRAALARTEESQGKLLAAIHEETERCNRLMAQRLEEIKAFLNLEIPHCVNSYSDERFSAVNGRLDALGNQFGELLELLALKAPRKEPKQPTYCQEHGPRGYVCCKKFGHLGRHVADDGEKTVETWPAPRRKSSRRKKGGRKRD